MLGRHVPERVLFVLIPPRIPREITLQLLFLSAQLVQFFLDLLVGHPQFFAGLFLPLLPVAGALLALGLRDLEKVIYYEEYVVLDPGTTPLKKKALLSAAINELPAD